MNKRPTVVYLLYRKTTNSVDIFGIFRNPKLMNETRDKFSNCGRPKCMIVPLDTIPSSGVEL